VATDSSVPPAARVSAARALLECSIGHYDPARVDARITVDGPEVESLAARLEALARAHNANGDDSGGLPQCLREQGWSSITSIEWVRMDRERLRFLNSAIGKGLVAAIVVGAIVVWLMGR
jgi:hypothetical protein